MKKYILILIIAFILFFSFSCIFFPEGNEKFKEKINHRLLWQKIYSTEFAAIAELNCFDGQYFYFGLTNGKEAGIVKFDLNGNNVWGKMVNLTLESSNQKVNHIQSISKIEDKLYIIASNSRDFGSYDHNLIILNADNGEYYGIYPLDPDYSGASCFRADQYENIVYVALNIPDEGLHIYCFDKNSNSPLLIKERFFPNVRSSLTASKFIHDGKMYFRGRMDGKIRSLIVMDCLAICDENKTNEECIVKIIDGDYNPGCSNIIVNNNQIVTYYVKEIIQNALWEHYYICYDKNTYEKIWESKDDCFRTPSWVDFQVYKNFYFVPKAQTYVDCYSLIDGHLVWRNDNSIYVNDTTSGWNNESTGAIINGRWYAQPVYSGSCVIIYDINSGEKVGRIENQIFSILSNEVCWSVENKLYILTYGGYFNCFEIESKVNNSNIFILFFIFFITFTMYL
ncbi:MAG: hypothetical protein WH035_03740, partial [Spirochaetota bacterium]